MFMLFWRFFFFFLGLCCFLGTWCFFGICCFLEPVFLFGIFPKWIFKTWNSHCFRTTNWNYRHDAFWNMLSSWCFLESQKATHSKKQQTYSKKSNIFQKATYSKIETKVNPDRPTHKLLHRSFNCFEQYRTASYLSKIKFALVKPIICEFV